MKQVAVLTLMLCLIVGHSIALAQTVSRTVIIERPGGQKEVFRGLGLRDVSTKLGQFFKSSEDGKFRILDPNAAQKDSLKFLKQGDQVEVITRSAGSAEEMYQEYALGYDRGLLTICKSNLKNIATANEMYSTDWSGRYPQDLEKLTPNYLIEIPRCQAEGAPPYSYEASERDDENEDAFELSCHGDHSSLGMPLGYPRYNWLYGLLTEPRGPDRGEAEFLKAKEEWERQRSFESPVENLPELQAPTRRGEGDPDLLMDLEMAAGMPGYEQAQMLEPILSTQKSIGLGRDLFAQNCTLCHGDQGKGDGPAGMALNPKPTDLTDPLNYAHGRLELGVFRSIYFGIPGTGAAPWAGHLDSVTEIWPLVHYVQSLQHK